MLVGGCSFFEDATTVPVDYEVELIEPVEFDGSNALAPATVDVAVSAASPTATWTIPNADKWGPMLHANAMAEDAGEDRIFSIRPSTPPTFTGTAPVSFSIDVYSETDVWGDTLSPVPMDVTSCTFILDPATAQPDDFGIALENCLVDWTDTNGVPAELGVSVTTASTAAAAGGTPDYSYTSPHVMETNEPFEVDCDSEIAVPDSVTDHVDDISFRDIQLDAVGTANDPVIVGWFGFIFDSEFVGAAYGFGFEAMGAGDTRDYHAAVEGGDVTTDGNANVELFPADPEEFLDATINALAGVDTGNAGGGAACWFSFGATPRSGTLVVSIEGDARAGL